MAGRPIKPILLDEDQRAELQARIRASSSAIRDVERARIVLLRAEGLSQNEVAERLGCSPRRVSKWSARFRRLGLEGLKDEAGRGRKPSIAPEIVNQVLTEATKNPPPGRTRWSTRSMAKKVGIAPSSVGRIWRSNDLKPHQTRIFKLSTDPQFEEKFWDIVGLYLDPPEKALVLCCDEKSQCQALERSQRALPLCSGHRKTMTHDYLRHGTVTLFAALNYLEGKIISRTDERHTHVEWLAFLKQIDRECPVGNTLHLILDNYATHKKDTVKSWLEERNAQHLRRHGMERFKLHFTPTSSSWLNLVERFFADLTEHSLRKGSFSSIQELTKQIESYLVEHNLNPKRYIWRAKGEEILRKIRAARDALENPTD